MIRQDALISNDVVQMNMPNSRRGVNGHASIYAARSRFSVMESEKTSHELDISDDRGKEKRVSSLYSSTANESPNSTTTMVNEIFSTPHPAHSSMAKVPYSQPPPVPPKHDMQHIHTRELNAPPRTDIDYVSCRTSVYSIDNWSCPDTPARPFSPPILEPLNELITESERKC